VGRALRALRCHFSTHRASSELHLTPNRVPSRPHLTHTTGSRQTSRS
jgi:hypothetical protein